MAPKGAVVVQFLPDPVQYNPNQPRDKETAKRIRSHIAGNLRRKKLQILLNPTTSPITNTIPPSQLSLANNFCTCIVLQVTPPEQEPAKSKALQKQRAIADTYKLCPRCHKVRFLELSWLGQLKTARQRIPSVTPFLESEFDPFQSLPELSQYKQSPQAKRLMNEFKAHLIVYMPYEVLRNNVLSAAAKTPALFMSLLYASCSHLEAVREGGESQLSIAIKTEAMRQINLRLDDPKKRNTPETLVSIGYLSSGVFAVGADNVIEETETHEAGMMRIWYEGLGAKVPEGCALSSTLIKILILHSMSRAATLAQPIDPTFIFAFCQYSHAYSNDEFLPESPLFCPRSDFFTIKKSNKCSIYTLQILRGLKNLIDWMIEDPPASLPTPETTPEPTVSSTSQTSSPITLSTLNSSPSPPLTTAPFNYTIFRSEMLSLPSASLKTSPEKVRGDYIYECLRIIANIFVYCVDMRCSFVHVPERFVLALKLALQKTDIGGYWGSMSGLFFFVAMIGSASAMRKPQHGFMGTIIARADHEIVYGNPVFEGGTIASWRLQRVHLELLRGWEEGRKRGASLGLDLDELGLGIGMDDFGAFEPVNFLVGDFKGDLVDVGGGLL